MAGVRPGRLSAMWTNIKKSLLIYRSKENFVGQDEFGNKYFEKLHDPASGMRGQRRVEPVNPDQFVVPTVPAEWMTWLQNRRQNPPTEQEQETNKQKILQTQSRASELERQRRVSPGDENTVQSSRSKQGGGGIYPTYPGYEIHPGETEAKKNST